ncbi:dihydrofolate reductase family protein [Microbispora sp. ATCC PTA-5024]|uniref:dihydrofolate reductase family protein n=1 Tax=Microbispora sp. ATCC PTA-5024 TaxID=316330 RepID=UPI0003DDA22C|nr:dihydrofolate reductase family protein [Microbispora sp. ATCC PTA-5024]ETK34917.1 hypothetical protein MPTA5024_16985 [Microbispora sp. ATCC PTA-5024]
MAKVVVHVTMSLDGFMAGPRVSAESPMGEGGLRLHEWVFNASDGGPDGEVMRELSAVTRAVVLGRRTFDVGVGVWEDTPFPAPSFVVTHERRPPMPMKSATFTFVDDGLASAIRQARAVAGEGTVVVMGADVTQQALRAGLVDEIDLQLAPVLLGDGLRLFDHLGPRRVELQRTRVIESPYVTHLRYRVMTPSP